MAKKLVTATILHRHMFLPFVVMWSCSPLTETGEQHEHLPVFYFDGKQPGPILLVCFDIPVVMAVGEAPKP